MSIESISEAIWPDILALQAEVYEQIEPESLEVLQDKWRVSPECCFTYRDGQKGLMGYLLSHAWNQALPPKLHRRLPSDLEGDVLFLHDLAISNRAAGKGIGSKLVRHLVAMAKGAGFKEIRLVSIQDSKAFWHKQGFESLEWEACSSYGDDAHFMLMRLQ